MDWRCGRVPALQAESKIQTRPPKKQKNSPKKPTNTKLHLRFHFSRVKIVIMEKTNAAKDAGKKETLYICSRDY
jgi:hypothetical protein